MDSEIVLSPNAPLFTISGENGLVSTSVPTSFSRGRGNNKLGGRPRGSSLTALRSSSMSSTDNNTLFKGEDTMCEMTTVNEIVRDYENGQPLLDNHDCHRRTASEPDDHHSDPSSSERSGPQPFHCHVPRPGVNKTARNQLTVVTVLCFLFMIGEIIGGTLANSLALISDATHLASDLSGFLVSLFAISVAARPPTAKLSFGFYRAEVMGALASILIIWITTGVLVYLAVQRVINQNYTIEADSMLITAGAGVAFNIIMGIVLNSSVFGCQAVAHAHSHGGHGHSHGGHGHAHNHDEGEDGGQGMKEENQQTDNNAHVISRMSECSDDGTPVRNSKKKDVNINVRAAFIHIIGDLFQSIGVLIAAYVIKYKPEYKLADPICTFLFSILVLISTITILRDTLLILLEGVPRNINYRMCKFDLETLDGVKAVHSLNIWCLSPDRVVISAHIVLGDSEIDRKQLMRKATMILRKKYKAFQTTIQIEDYNEDLMSACEDCLGPKLC